MSENGCFICGEELKYKNSTAKMVCEICGNEFDSNASCLNGHFICDSCHQLEGVEFIGSFCLATSHTSPVDIVNDIMKHKSIKPHGPEHHFLVPASLLTSYYKAVGQPELLPMALVKARKRAANVLGGFCGFYGACGAGVGTGIFISVILNGKPISGREYSLANQITANSLNGVAKAGGPRCCKRNTFIAIETAIDFVENNLNVVMPHSEIQCQFSSSNKECLYDDCKYYHL